MVSRERCQDTGGFLSDSILVKYELTTAMCRIHEYSGKPANEAHSTVHPPSCPAWCGRTVRPHSGYTRMPPFCLLWLEVLSWDELLIVPFESSGIFPSLPALVAQPLLQAPLTCKLWYSLVPGTAKLYKVIMVCFLRSPHRPYNFSCRVFLHS